VESVLAIFRRIISGAVKLEKLSDEELMNRYRDGETRAFEVLLERHRTPVFNFLCRYLHDRERSEDLLQETFLRLIRNVQSYTPRAKFTTWLYTIARNLAIDEVRRVRHHRNVSLDQPMRGTQGDEDGPTYLDRLAAPGGRGDDRLADGQFAAALYAALEALPPEQREVFLLREAEAMPFQEIAEIVGAPLNTVKSRMRYALEGLREMLSEHRVEQIAEELVAP
jgi:RNA polymerase sigma-70 factor, ECF subfamily